MLSITKALHYLWGVKSFVIMFMKNVTPGNGSEPDHFAAVLPTGGVNSNLHMTHRGQHPTTLRGNGSAGDYYRDILILIDPPNQRPR